nr:hypothetical protein [Tanacetum cinerariifolium]
CKLFSRGNSSTRQWEHFFTGSGKIALAVGTILHYQWELLMQWEISSSSGNFFWQWEHITGSGKTALEVGMDRTFNSQHSRVKNSSRRYPPKARSRSVCFLMHSGRLIGRKTMFCNDLPTRFLSDSLDPLAS